MTTPIEPTPATPSHTHTHSLDVRRIVSGLETLAFVVAVVLQALGYHSDAIITALAGASAHAVNHS